MLSLAVLISGGGSNLRAILEATASPDFPAKVTVVGADRDAEGFAHADEFDVPGFVVKPGDYANRDEWGAALLEKLREADADLVVGAGFMRILPAGVVRELSPALINTHPALLPHFPGAHAVRDAILAGAAQSGSTVHIIDEGVDTGPVIAQTAVDVLAEDTEETLHERIKVVERELLVETIRRIALGEVDLPALAAAR